jgi:hypothetical protein
MGGGGQLFSGLGCLEPNPGEIKSDDSYYVVSASHFCTVSPATRRLDYTLNNGGEEVADQARRFIVTGSRLNLCNFVMCRSCSCVVSAHVTCHLQVQCDMNWGSGSICKSHGEGWNVI